MGRDKRPMVQQPKHDAKAAHNYDITNYCNHSNHSSELLKLTNPYKYYYYYHFITTCYHNDWLFVLLCVLMVELSFYCMYDCVLLKITADQLKGLEPEWADPIIMMIMLVIVQITQKMH